MDKVLEEVFDTITHHYHDNRYNLEGWKTNSHYLVNEKIILPWITSNEWESFRVRYSSQGNVNKIEDFCKALCYVEGVDYDTIGGLYLFVNKNAQEWGKWFDWGFFECKGFKKGTMHFKFKDRNVWARFNQRIAKIKGYLHYQKKFSSMSIKENKELRERAIQMLIDGKEMHEIKAEVFPDVTREMFQELMSIAISESSYTEKRVNKYSVNTYYNNGLGFNWDRELTEDDYMSMPLPNEWRLPMFK